MSALLMAEIAADVPPGRGVQRRRRRRDRATLARSPRVEMISLTGSVGTGKATPAPPESPEAGAPRARRQGSRWGADDADLEVVVASRSRWRLPTPARTAPPPPRHHRCLVHPRRRGRRHLRGGSQPGRRTDHRRGDRSSARSFRRPQAPGAGLGRPPSRGATAVTGGRPIRRRLTTSHGRRRRRPARRDRPARGVRPGRDRAVRPDLAAARRHGQRRRLRTGRPVFKRPRRRSGHGGQRPMRFGTVWVNDHIPLVVEMPHGGFKQSATARTCRSARRALHRALGTSAVKW